MTDGAHIDRRHVQLAVFREAEKELRERIPASASPTGSAACSARYTRNLALGRPRADRLALRSDRRRARHRRRQLCVGSLGDRGALSAAERSERYRRPCTSPAKKSGCDTRKIRLRRRLPSTKRRLRPVGLKPRKKEKFPGEWASELNGNSICSYPPEDLVIEDYGRFLKKKGKSILSEERVARGALHHLPARRHRHPRNHSQLARAAASTCAASEKCTAKSARWS